MGGFFASLAANAATSSASVLAEAGQQKATLKAEDQRIKDEQIADEAAFVESERRRRLELSSIVSAQRAAFGAMGIDAGSGSPLALSLSSIDDSTREAEYDYWDLQRRKRDRTLAQDSLKQQRSLLYPTAFMKIGHVGAQAAMLAASRTTAAPTTPKTTGPSPSSPAGGAMAARS